MPFGVAADSGKSINIVSVICLDYLLIGITGEVCFASICLLSLQDVMVGLVPRAFFHSCLFSNLFITGTKSYGVLGFWGGDPLAGPLDPSLFLEKEKKRHAPVNS